TDGSRPETIGRTAHQNSQVKVKSLKSGFLFYLTNEKRHTVWYHRNEEPVREERRNNNGYQEGLSG
ncbi:MAG: hypothetical protein IIY25_05755, partial [Erysipelotrichaceae bacterium]|nr:hypothetical protein [Erysipelotrichaceae bacterium]